MSGESFLCLAPKWHLVIEKNKDKWTIGSFGPMLSMLWMVRWLVNIRVIPIRIVLYNTSPYPGCWEPIHLIPSYHIQYRFFSLFFYWGQFVFERFHIDVAFVNINNVKMIQEFLDEE
ncbi:MAG: hypothetical protein MUF15_20455 [Acidobacteria bacterium]|nr:hypothetical protein [Acidobacteriota bacterium]